MKKVLLIGDSIRKGYDEYVKHALEDTCEVYFPADNCRFAQYVLRHLHDWKNELELGDDVDVVHWNAGHWDSLVLYEDGCLTPPDFYEYFMDKVCKRIKVLFPKAKVIFATSTPVLEHRFTNPAFSYRLNSDIQRYNEIAVKVAQKHGFSINDLYAVTENIPEDYYSDMTHMYTPEGTQILTNAVIKAIGAALDTEYDEFTVSDYQGVKEVIGH